MTPEEISTRLNTLTSAVNGVDQDVQDLQTLRKNDALIVRAVASDVAEVKERLGRVERLLEDQGKEIRTGMGSLAAMLQTLIDQDKPEASEDQ